jgi:hypothetical protein
MTVDVEEQLAGRRVPLCERQHDALQFRHVERRRCALAGHVGDQQREPVAVERQIVVVVATHFARRFAMRGERETRHQERALRQQRHLDASRDPQFLLEALLLRLLLQQLLDAAGHRLNDSASSPS